ncbi:MAG: phosphoribosylanthranilate isomerase [Anaerolineales bacterium]
MVMVKICGITRLEDALAALDAGADLLGFNFYPGSRRYISPSSCYAITDELARRNESVGLVGVFVNESAQNILKVLDDCGLTLAQCHGDESVADLAMLKGRAYKAIRPRNRNELDELLHQFASTPCTPQLLVDTYHNATYGGSGKTGNWQLASLAAQQYPIFLAGGLNAENVASAVQQVRPWGVDVASGVENRAGIKDITKMKLFIKNAKGC